MPEPPKQPVSAADLPDRAAYGKNVLYIPVGKAPPCPCGNCDTDSRTP